MTNEIPHLSLTAQKLKDIHNDLGNILKKEIDGKIRM